MRTLLLALVLALPLRPGDARANEGVALGLEVNADYRLENDRTLTFGNGGTLRLGYQYPNGLTPQVLVTGAYWSGDEGTGAARLDVSGYAALGLVGLRWNVLPDVRSGVAPWLAANVGGGLLGTSAGAVSDMQPGLAVVAGGGLDFPIPTGGADGIAVGTHLTYNRLVIADKSGVAQGVTWLVIGADLSLVFQ